MRGSRKRGKGCGGFLHLIMGKARDRKKERKNRRNQSFCIHLKPKKKKPRGEREEILILINEDLGWLDSTISTVRSGITGTLQ